MKPKKDDRKFGTYWIDPEIPGTEMTHAEFLAHIKKAYGIDASKTQGKRTMKMHMDGSDWFSWEWDWEIAGRSFTQCSVQKRRGRDLEIWNSPE